MKWRSLLELVKENQVSGHRFADVVADEMGISEREGLDVGELGERTIVQVRRGEWPLRYAK